MDRVERRDKLAQELAGNEYGYPSDAAATQDARIINDALLALAFEQRTANLIAFLDGASTPLPSGDGPRELYDAIVNRLGLKEDQ